MALALIVHGGAGGIPDAAVAAHREGVRRAAQVGWEILRQGGNAVDAVQAAIIVMEDDSAFDAGYGSVLNRDGQVEMDASMMDGRTLDAGGIAGVQRIKNPIRLARHVMESEHTLLIAQGAERFAQEMGMALIDNVVMRAPQAIAEWGKNLQTPPIAPRGEYVPVQGTVGCVAVDRNGNIVAGTSTGGMEFKRPGRVGDSPIIGAGTYADNQSGGASATGWGESITRVVMSKYAIDALANDRHPNEAARAAIEMLAKRVGGTGGIIIADRFGRVGHAFNTPRMAWACLTEDMPDVVVDC